MAATAAIDRLLGQAKTQIGSSRLGPVAKATWEAGTRILVAGGFGYVGGELVKGLEKHGIDYISVDKKSQAGKKRVCLDLCDRKATADVIERFKPDVFVHCATNSALAYHGNFLESFRNDAMAIVNILEPLSKLPDCRMVYFSSSYVYSGLASKSSVAESVLLQPSHNFGVAKSFFERFVLQGHPNAVVFRLSSVFGHGNALNPNAIFSMAKECIGKKGLAVWGTGSRKMQYVYISDVLAYVCEAFTMQPGVYNLGGDEYLSVAESARMIADFFGAGVKFLKDKKEGETLPFMDCSKLKRASADHITPFPTALKEYLGLLRENFK